MLLLKCPFNKGVFCLLIFLKKYVIILYKEKIEKNDLHPVVEPAVDVTGISDGSVIFKFTIITKPEVKIKKYIKACKKKGFIVFLS